MMNPDFDFTDGPMLRKKAEERLLEQNGAKSQPVMEADLKKLLHELQVHQIELEMQNEELMLAYDTVQDALKKYTMIYDLAPVGFFIIDSGGSIHDLNFTAADLLGDRRFTLWESNFKLFVAEDSLQKFNHFLKQVYLTSAKMTCEMKLGYDGKPLSTVYMEGVVTGDDNKCLLSVIDLSLQGK